MCILLSHILFHLRSPAGHPGTCLHTGYFLCVTDIDWLVIGLVLDQSATLPKETHMQIIQIASWMSSPDNTQHEHYIQYLFSSYVHHSAIDLAHHRLQNTSPPFHALKLSATAPPFAWTLRTSFSVFVVTSNHALAQGKKLFTSNISEPPLVSTYVALKLGRYRTNSLAFLLKINVPVETT